MSALPILTFPAHGLLLGRDPRQRMRASQTLLALTLIALFALVQQFEASSGLVPHSAAKWLSLFNVGSSLMFFLLIRSGINLRLAPREPSMTFPQCVCAITSMAWAYAISGPVRGGLLAVLILIILFGGLFQLRAAQTRHLSLYAFLLLATVMGWRTQIASERYDPQVELVHFAFTVLVLIGANLVAGRFGQMRERLSRQKAELAEALEINRELATRDMLTGLLNRRAMVEMLVRQPPRAQRGDGLMALAILDIDHFKRVNDSCGHGVGDVVLHRFAGVLGQGIRKGDLLARWGGEEFLLLMPGTTAAEGGRALERLRQLVALEDWGALAAGLPVTFSAGCSELRPGEDHEAAIERADQALYRAKATGRDRFEFG
jgi:diguanylate cyclase (GGDEF)-like protein